MSSFCSRTQHNNDPLFYSKKGLRAFVLVCCLLVITACGKKPPQVDPPIGEHGVFPRVYPNPDLEKSP